MAPPSLAPAPPPAARVAVDGLAAFGRFRIDLLVGLCVVFALLIIGSAVAPRPPRSGVSWGLLAFGVALGAGALAAGRGLRRSRRTSALLGASGALRL